jgi:hypothetical protein
VLSGAHHKRCPARIAATLTETLVVGGLIPIETRATFSGIPLEDEPKRLTLGEIVYLCKQDPIGTGTNILWNHKWRYYAPNPLQVKPRRLTNRSGCSTKTRTRSTNTVLLRRCGYSHHVHTLCLQKIAKMDRCLQLRRLQLELLFVDHLGCRLFAGLSSLHGNLVSRMRAAACNGSVERKWKAPPVCTDSDFGGFLEVSQ